MMRLLWFGCLLLTACPGAVEVCGVAEIISPALAEAVSGEIHLQVEVADDAFVSSVTFLLDGEVVDQDWLPPYEGWLDTNSIPDGELLMVARLEYLRPSMTPIEVETPFIVDNHGPDVELTAPLPSDCVRDGLLRIAANVHDDVEVASVSFLLDGEAQAQLRQPPYAASVELTAAGAGIDLTIVAENERGFANAGVVRLEACEQ